MYCKIHILIGRMCDTFSVYSMMFMAVSRYSVISNTAGKGIGIKHTYHLVYGSLLLALLSALPEAVNFSIVDLAKMFPQRFPENASHTICTNSLIGVPFRILVIRN